MAKEIERKFLVNHNILAELGEGEAICQGYIPTQGKTAIRVRIKADRAFLTLKGENQGAVRSEFEYPIPIGDARAILAELCPGPKIEKTRFTRQYDRHLWEIDVFAGDNAGLVVAEVELSEENEVVKLPGWVHKEVTGDPRYYNTSLLTNPYCQW
jgi:adenylate cyclase